MIFLLAAYYNSDNSEYERIDSSIGSLIEPTDIIVNPWSSVI